MRPRVVLLLVLGCAGILVLVLLTGPAIQVRENPTTRAGGVEGSDLALDREVPPLDTPDPLPPTRTQAAPTFGERVAVVLALPETTVDQVTTKREALEALMTETAPKGKVLRLKQGLDWKAKERCEDPERWAAGDEVFRLRKLERDTRYADYLASRGR